ncbi:MAG: DUF6242 domain-containing protein [Tannerella sp.]|jgi:hypothetical protein|nr:DUF6242 domain-containing protein [Tannerella sp.]
MKNLINSWLLIAIVSVMLTSCLGDDDFTTDDWNLKNAQIMTFTLSNDSIAGLASVVFTIDQINGKIFNQDSMPFGTAIDEKVLCDLTFDIYSAGVQVMSQATGDTVFWTTSDSIDFSQPVIFKVYAADAETTKEYEAWINIHQVNPDSMVWDNFLNLAEGQVFEEMKAVVSADTYYVYVKESGVAKLFKSGSSVFEFSETALSGFPENAVISSVTECNTFIYVIDEDGKLYFSENGATWYETDAVGIKTILGSHLNNNAYSDLCCIADINDTLKFYTYNLDKGQTAGDEVPENFPITGFSSVAYEIRHFQHLILASGRDTNGNLTNTAWDTMDGLRWVPLTNKWSPFVSSEGASIARYDNLLFLIGGFGEDGNAIDTSYFSKDNGVTWRDTVFSPIDYKSRGFSTVTVDKDNYMFLFGGKETKDGSMINEVWRGRVNRLGFKED